MVKKIMILFVALSLAAALTVQVDAGAKLKECKDLKTTRCKQRTDCKWVKKHKKGTAEVKAHCRKCMKKTGCAGN